jgi:twitching motility protein PilT
LGTGGGLVAAAFFPMNIKNLDRFLSAANEFDASDLHLVAGVPPAFRVNGEIIIADEDALTEGEINAMADSLLNEQQQKKFEQEWELCISLLHSVAGRVRATFYRRNGHPEMSFRFCGERIATREDLGLPERVDDLARKPNGLVLVTGPTGAGKTTTLNYMVDLINGERRCKIVTIEDPIEFVHQNKRAIVVQQEVLTDVRSFNRALVHVLRQDPDVIVVGEMRDFEAISTAITAAETGHLVLATMHSPNVSHALERIIGVFEGSAQRQIILQLSNALQGIISQELLPAADRTRRVLAYEMLVANSAVRNLIRENQFHQLENILQTGRKEGMVLMDNCLYDLYCKCLISYDTAVSRARHPERIIQPKS